MRSFVQCGLVGLCEEGFMTDGRSTYSSGSRAQPATSVPQQQQEQLAGHPCLACWLGQPGVVALQ